MNLVYLYPKVTRDRIIYTFSNAPLYHYCTVILMIYTTNMVYGSSIRDDRFVRNFGPFGTKYGISIPITELGRVIIIMIIILYGHYNIPTRDVLYTHVCPSAYNIIYNIITLLHS